MKKVWCVFTNYTHENQELMGIYMNEADADAYIENNRKYYHLVKEEWEVN